MARAKSAVKVGVLGAAGKMGLAICQALEKAPGVDLVCAVDPASAGKRLSDLVPVASPLVITAELSALLESGATVAVDFTHADAATENLAFCADHGLHVVCGTTGIDQHALTELAKRFSGPPGPNLIVAPNFAISAALLMRFVEEAAPYFSGVEVIELHHDEKRDAPSGTALETARRIAAARAASVVGPFGADPTTDLNLEGARGGELDGVRVHSVRLEGLVAHEEVIFGAKGQSLTIRQDSYDRSSFLPGIVLACARIGELSGFTYGLDRLLGP